jgi:hypothetical protein
MLCETQCTLVASTVAYSRLYAGDDKIDDAPLFTALAVIVGTWAVALGTFLLSINRTHLNTFVSTETGAQFLRRRFGPRPRFPVASTKAGCDRRVPKRPRPGKNSAQCRAAQCHAAQCRVRPSAVRPKF